MESYEADEEDEIVQSIPVPKRKRRKKKKKRTKKEQVESVLEAEEGEESVPSYSKKKRRKKKKKRGKVDSAGVNKNSVLHIVGAASQAFAAALLRNLHTLPPPPTEGVGWNLVWFFLMSGPLMSRDANTHQLDPYPDQDPRFWADPDPRFELIRILDFELIRILDFELIRIRILPL